MNTEKRAEPQPRTETYFIDFDGVLCDIITPITAAHRLLARTVPGSPECEGMNHDTWETWHAYRYRWGISSFYPEGLYDDDPYDLYKTAKPYPGAISALRLLLSKENHKVVILTVCETDAHAKAKQRWIREKLPKDLHTLADGRHFHVVDRHVRKGAVVRAETADRVHFYDDKLESESGLWQPLISSQIHTWLVKRPWNTNRSGTASQAFEGPGLPQYPSSEDVETEETHRAVGAYLDQYDAYEPRRFKVEKCVMPNELPTATITYEPPAKYASDDAPRSVCQEAHALQSGDRQNQYGSPDQDFRRTAEMANALFGDKLRKPLTNVDVSMFMILLKLSRQTHQTKRDNWVDIAGYAQCGQFCDDANAKGGDA